MLLIYNDAICWRIYSVFSRYFPEQKLPENVIATTDAKTALLGADYCLHAVPVQVFQVSVFCCFLLYYQILKVSQEIFNLLH